MCWVARANAVDPDRGASQGFSNRVDILRAIEGVEWKQQELHAKTKAQSKTKLRAEISSKKKAIRDCVWRLGSRAKTTGLRERDQTLSLFLLA